MHIITLTGTTYPHDPNALQPIFLQESGVNANDARRILRGDDPDTLGEYLKLMLDPVLRSRTGREVPVESREAYDREDYHGAFLTLRESFHLSDTPDADRTPAELRVKTTRFNTAPAEAAPAYRRDLVQRVTTHMLDNLTPEEIHHFQDGGCRDLCELDWTESYCSALEAVASMETAVRELLVDRLTP